MGALVRNDDVIDVALVKGFQGKGWLMLLRFLNGLESEGGSGKVCVPTDARLVGAGNAARLRRAWRPALRVMLWGWVGSVALSTTLRDGLVALSNTSRDGLVALSKTSRLGYSRGSDVGLITRKSADYRR